MKKHLLLLLALSICHHPLFAKTPTSQPAATAKTLKKEPSFRFDRQKKIVQGEIDQFHQAFDVKSTLSYDIRYLDTGEKILEKSSYMRLHPGSLIGLATAISALELLGRDFAFQSTVSLKTPITSKQLKRGVFTEDLYVDLFLDPHMSYPKMIQLAQQIKKKGISTLEGMIVFADYPQVALGEGWNLPDTDPLVLYLHGQMKLENTTLSRKEAFILALKESGIIVKDPSTSYSVKKTDMPTIPLAQVHSQTLIPLLQQGWEEKAKVTFEALILALGELRQKANQSLRLGLLQMRDFLALRVLLNCDEMAFFDGSGTSTLSLFSAKQFTSLFLFAKNQFHLDADLLATLPMMKLNLPTTGFKAPPQYARAAFSAEGNVASIAGVVETERKRKVVFCCIVNHASLEKEKAEDFLNAFCQTLFENL